MHEFEVNLKLGIQFSDSLPVLCQLGQSEYVLAGITESLENILSILGCPNAYDDNFFF